MQSLTRDQTAQLRNWFLPEQPGSLVGSHVILTGNGRCAVNRWPDPQAVMVEVAGNYTLLGDAHGLSTADIRPQIKGFVECSDDFLPLLSAAFPDATVWPRVIFEQPASPQGRENGQALIRRLAAPDAHHLQNLDPECGWITNMWSGPQGLASSGYAYGAFVAGKLAAVACTGFVGEEYEDIGVVTEPRFRGLGLSPACAAALCSDIRARGHKPSWQTSRDNLASIRVAEKLGFVVHRYSHLYVVGVSIPRPATFQPVDDSSTC